MKNLLLLVIATFYVSILSAATFTVTNLNDAGPGSMRQAIMDSNVTPENDIINVMVNGIIDFTTASVPDFNILPNLGGTEINGDADGDGNAIVFKTTLDGRFFQVTDCTFNDINFDGGRAPCTGGLVFASGNNFFNRCLFINGFGGTIDPTCGQGGGFRIFSGTTTMTDCTIRNNMASTGAAIVINDAGTLDLFNCTIVDNVVLPGGTAPSAIWVRGTLNMTNCIIANTTPAGTPDILDAGTTVETNINNLVENYFCEQPSCASIVFDFTDDPMLVPTSSDPYFLYALDPASPVTGMGIGAMMAPGGAPISIVAAAPLVPTMGEWALVCLSLTLLIFGVVWIRETSIAIA